MEQVSEAPEGAESDPGEIVGVMPDGTGVTAALQRAIDYQERSSRTQASLDFELRSWMHDRAPEPPVQ